MKKISILIAFAMILTIGGVYATWNYAQGEIASIDMTQSAVLTEKVIDTPMGSISVNNNLEIIIDDTNDDHVAELIIEGGINIVFTAHELAPENVRTNGIPMQYTITTTTSWEYAGTQIFTAQTAPILINDGNATFTATITAAEIMNALTLANISLPTVADYDAFELALANGEIIITVSEIQ